MELKVSHIEMLDLALQEWILFTDSADSDTATNPESACSVLVYDEVFEYALGINHP